MKREINKKIYFLLTEKGGYKGYRLQIAKSFIFSLFSRSLSKMKRLQIVRIGYSGPTEPTKLTPALLSSCQLTTNIDL